MDKNVLYEFLQQYKSENKVRIKIEKINNEFFQNLNWFINAILNIDDLLYLLDSVESILHELINNAYKAEIKKIFFKVNNLDPLSKEQYKLALKKFSHFYQGPNEQYKELIQDNTVTIYLLVEKKPQSIKLSVINNRKLYPWEKERINKRRTEVDNYNDFLEAYEKFHDEEEGAGLGLVLIDFIMRNSGFPKNSFQIESNENETKASLIIPKQFKPKEIDVKIKSRILEGIDLLPSFPVNILKIIQLCGNPSSSNAQISSLIKKDPALAADVLKMANSPGFFIARRIDNINDALITIGLNQLESVLIAVHIKKILDKNTQKYKEIWKHSYRVATYNSYLSVYFNYKTLKESAYLAGLLHDLGKLAILSIDEILHDVIITILNRNNDSRFLFIEEATIGISHITIGALLAKKWQFPDKLVEAIKGHHVPDPKANNKPLIYLTYLADTLTGIIEKKQKDIFIEKCVRDFFQLHKDIIFKLAEECEAHYQSTIQN